jgi:hypothetical protein
MSGLRPSRIRLGFRVAGADQPERASAHETLRSSNAAGEAVRLLRRTGARPPRTIPTAWESARYCSCRPGCCPVRGW